MIAGVAELGDARDLKSLGTMYRAGSIPALGINLLKQYVTFGLLIKGKTVDQARLTVSFFCKRISKFFFESDYKW